MERRTGTIRARAHCLSLSLSSAVKLESINETTQNLQRICNDSDNFERFKSLNKLPLIISGLICHPFNTTVRFLFVWPHFLTCIGYRASNGLFIA